MNPTTKLKLEFEGWHCLPKKDTLVVLKLARQRFKNANFVDNNGLLIETDNQIDSMQFVLDVLDFYEKYFGAWDGFSIRKISRRIIYNFSDKKRKLKYEYFKKLVLNSDFDDIKIVLAGILYLEPVEVKNVLLNIEKDIDKLFVSMNEDDLKKAYNDLIKYAAMSVRKLSVEEGGGDEL